MKFGTKVKIVSKGFYQGAKGVIVNMSKIDQNYDVKLDHGVTKSFYKSELRKI